LPGQAAGWYSIISDAIKYIVSVARPVLSGSEEQKSRIDNNHEGSSRMKHNLRAPALIGLIVGIFGNNPAQADGTTAWIADAVARAQAMPHDQ
jgi:hypothetical protein